MVRYVSNGAVLGNGAGVEVCTVRLSRQRRNGSMWDPSTGSWWGCWVSGVTSSGERRKAPLLVNPVTNPIIYNLSISLKYIFTGLSWGFTGCIHCPNGMYGPSVHSCRNINQKLPKKQVGHPERWGSPRSRSKKRLRRAQQEKEEYMRADTPNVGDNLFVQVRP